MTYSVFKWGEILPKGSLRFSFICVLHFHNTQYSSGFILLWFKNWRNIMVACNLGYSDEARRFMYLKSIIFCWPGCPNNYVLAQELRVMYQNRSERHLVVFCTVNPILHGHGPFYLLVLLRLDFVSWIFIKNFQTCLEVKIHINQVNLTPCIAHWVL